MRGGERVTRPSERLDLTRPGAHCAFRCASDGTALLALSSALASAPIAGHQRVGLRRLRTVRVKHPFPRGDFVDVEIAVDGTATGTRGELVASTSWTLTDARGETLAELKAELVCSDAEPAATQPLVTPGPVHDAETTGVEHIPV
jgi:hypothetical protein